MKETYIAHNYEGPKGRTEYAEETAGAYYAARLGALEYLNDIKRNAKVLIVRDVTPDYWAPLGVWVIRETVRNAFDYYQILEDSEKIKYRLSNEFMFLYKRISGISKLLSERQTSLSNFARPV